MKPGRLFWGVLFVALGILLLLQRFFFLDLYWEGMWKFWPLVLVVLGIAMVVRNQKAGMVAAGLAGAGLAFLLFIIFNAGWHLDEWRHEPVSMTEQELTQPYDSSIQRASFALESGAGVFTLSQTSDDLVKASTKSSFGTYVLHGTRVQGGEDVVLSLEGGDRHLHLRRLQNQAEIRLNSRPLWDMRFDVGAAKVDVDLSPFRVERVILNSGAADVRVKLGEPATETHLSISSGASSVRVFVPEGAGCEIRVSAPLSSKNFRQFTKAGDGLYRTENFTGNVKKIYVNVDAGVSSLSVKRY